VVVGGRRSCHHAPECGVRHRSAPSCPAARWRVGCDRSSGRRPAGGTATTPTPPARRWGSSVEAPLEVVCGPVDPAAPGSRGRRRGSGRYPPRCTPGRTGSLHKGRPGRSARAPAVPTPRRAGRGRRESRRRTASSTPTRHEGGRRSRRHSAGIEEPNSPGSPTTYPATGRNPDGLLRRGRHVCRGRHVPRSLSSGGAGPDRDTGAT